MPRPSPSEAVIRNAIEAAQKRGVEIGEVIIDPKSGTVRIVARDTAQPVASEPAPLKWAGRTG